MATMVTAIEPTQAPNFHFNYEELMALEVDRPLEIIEGMICERQNVLLAGRFGVGKTMLGVQMSLCLATGRDFVGRKIPRPYRTAIVDCENDLGDVKNRLAQQHDGLGLGEIEDALLKDNWNLASAADPDSALYGMKLDAGDFDPLKKYVNDHEPEILIIDNLGLVVQKGDLKEPHEAKNFYASLNALRKDYESLQTGAIIVMHHLTKPGESLAVEQTTLLNSPSVFLSRVRGTGRVLDFAQGRFAIAEEKVREQTYFVVNGVNRSTSPIPLILQFNQDTLLFERHEDANFRFESVFANCPKRREVYMVLPDEFSWSEAVDIINPKSGKPFTKDTLSKTLTMCKTEGFLTQDPDSKRYRKLVRMG